MNAPHTDQHKETEMTPIAARSNRGRRQEDSSGHINRLEVHPIAISVGVGILSVLLAVLGYFFKSWGDNVTYEIHQLRIVVQDQAKESAANSEWKSDMGRWRDDVDGHFREIDDQLSAQERAGKYRFKGSKFSAAPTPTQKSKP
jgi:hypothetical protein